MSAGAKELDHDALLYGSESEFVDALEPFVRDGLADDDAVMAVTTEANIAALRDALGPDAARVAFVRSEDWYQHPARTIAAYHGVLEECLSTGADHVRVIGEVRFGDREEQQREWIRYEAALNHAFADERAWIVCPYDVRALPAWIVGHAARTHSHLMRHGQRAASADYTDPRRTLAYLASPAPRLATPPLAELEVEEDLRPARRALRRFAGSIGMARKDAEQLALAVNEALTNALTHGEPPVRLRVYQDRRSLVCEVEDAGAAMTDLLAGYAPPGVASPPEHGMGLWLARQLCDHVAVHPGSDRTTIRLSKGLDDG